MQNRKKIVEKAMQHFTYENCKVLLRSDIQILIELFKANLNNHNYKPLKIILELIKILEANDQKTCFKYKSINTVRKLVAVTSYALGDEEDKEEVEEEMRDVHEEFEADELGDERFSDKFTEVYKDDHYGEFFKSNSFKKLNDFVSNPVRINQLIENEQDDTLVKMYCDENGEKFFKSNSWGNYFKNFDKILQYFLTRKKYSKVIQIINCVNYVYDKIDQESNHYKLPFYNCFMIIKATNDNSLINQLLRVYNRFIDSIINLESAKHVTEIKDYYVEKSDDDTILELIYKVYQNHFEEMGSSYIGYLFVYDDFMKQLIKAIAIKRPQILIEILIQLLSDKCITNIIEREIEREYEHFGYDEREEYSAEEMNSNRVRYYRISLIRISHALIIIIPEIPEKDIAFLLPLFDVMYKIPKFILRYHKNELKQDEKDTWALEAIQEISIVNDMLKNIKKLYESHSIKVAKHRILITVLEKLAGLKPLTPSSSLEIFPISYLINSLQSKDNHVSDSLFEILLLLFKDMNFNNEEDKKYLTKLLNIFFDYDKVDYVTKALRRLIVSIKPWVDKNIKRYNRDTTLFFILDYLFNRTIDENTSSSMQLENYVNILFDALDDRKHDELYEKNGLNEILVFEIISLNLKRVIEHSSIKNIIKLFPVIKLIRDTLEELVSENYLKAEYKEDELQNQIGINQFISSSFDIVLAHFNDIDCLKEPTEYFREDEWNLHKDIINKCYRKYQMKVLTGKVAGYLNFISRYLESSINTEDELINKKAKILANIVHVLNTKLRAYNEAKKNEEAKVEEQKKMLSFLTHTLRNSLSAGPEIAKSITGNLKFLLGDSYLENNTAYKTINNATSLLTTFKYVDNLIETFKLFSSNKSAITKKLENENDGDLLIGNLVNQVLNQTISKYLFYDSYLSERKQLFDSKNIKSIKESFLEQVLLNTETDNHADIVLSWLNNNSTIIQAGPYKTEFKIKNNGIRFGILFSIFSELISNSFSYFDGIGKIKIDLNESEKFIEFTCRDHYNENLNIIKGTNKGIYFIKHIVSLVNEISFEVSQQNGVWISIIRIKK